MTSKGQMTIPASFRKALRIGSGDYLAVSREGDRIIVEALATKRSEGGIVRRTSGIWRDTDFDLKDLRRSDESRFERLNR